MPRGRDGAQHGRRETRLPKIHSYSPGTMTRGQLGSALIRRECGETGRESLWQIGATSVRGLATVSTVMARARSRAAVSAVGASLSEAADADSATARANDSSYAFEIRSPASPQEEETVLYQQSLTIDCSRSRRMDPSRRRRGEDRIGAPGTLSDQM